MAAAAALAARDVPALDSSIHSRGNTGVRSSGARVALGCPKFHADPPELAFCQDETSAADSQSQSQSQSQVCYRYYIRLPSIHTDGVHIYENGQRETDQQPGKNVQINANTMAATHSDHDYEQEKNKNKTYQLSTDHEMNAHERRTAHTSVHPPT